MLLPLSINLSSALSCLNNNLNSALLVNRRYGSSVPFVVKSSTSTPIYASSLANTSGCFPSSFIAALIPAIIPWPAASSYPLVPLTCPAVNRFSMIFDSNVGFICIGSIASYSIAYAYFLMIASLNPGRECTICSWISLGKDVENP